MPDAFAGTGIQSQQAVGEQVGARPVRAVEIIRSRPGGEVGDSSLFVDGDLAPRVGGSGVLPGVFAPRVITELTRMGNGVKLPHDRAGDYVEGAQISRRREKTLARSRAHDNQIFKNL